ncbi:MAG: amino acid permease [Gammaproteobacteria bacterium]|nr:amino acid permease [Gammaproteobacteria bacterium]
MKKIGFWSVTSLVVGSQIGSGILLLPASLAPFGAIGLASWAITATGALCLALIFARLCAANPKPGGPHTYVEAAFGPKASFYAAWTYWVISWMSSAAVLIAIVGYLSPFLGAMDPLSNLLLEIAILLLLTWLNLMGVRAAGRVEFVFTLFKILPLLIIPCVGLWHINLEHFRPFNPTMQTPLSALNAAALLTLWGFIGLESATAPTEAVFNPAKTIPKAIVVGTAIVALVNVVNSFVMMGIMPMEALAHSKAPFAVAAGLLLGGNGSFIISVIAAIVCLGTLNAWVLTSGQIALGAAYDNHFPKFFLRKNQRGAPVWSLMISSLGVIPLLMLTMDADLINQVNAVIDISVTAFLFVYLFCVLSYFKLFLSKHSCLTDKKGAIVGVAALVFCLWALWSSGLKMVSMAGLITLSGVPIYYWQKRSALSLKNSNKD